MNAPGARLVIRHGSKFMIGNDLEENQVTFQQVGIFYSEIISLVTVDFRTRSYQCSRTTP